VASILVSLSSNVLKASRLVFISANITAICWGAIEVVRDLLDSPNRYM